jgi:hypothetical protein
VLRRLAMRGGPIETSSRGLAREVKLSRRQKPGRGDVVEILVRRVRPGGYDDALASAKSTLTFAERHGAVHGRLLQLTHAGRNTGLLALMWEFARPSNVGTLLDAWANDDKGVAIRNSSYDEFAATNDVSRTLYRSVLST